MAKTTEKEISLSVAAILERVRRGGDAALRFYTKKFDGLDLPPARFIVPQGELRRAWGRISDEGRRALLRAKKRIEAFHRRERAHIAGEWSLNLDGIRVGQRALPLSSVGLYVPGGRYAYPSTLLMSALPARAAGVRKVVAVTPPANLKDEILAAAYLARVDLFCRVGGPAAVAALAYGTRTLPKVEKIVGPGNAYVTEAKRQLYGTVGIDGLAGPSEIAVWADSSIDPGRIALNLLAQAEHDPRAKSFLFCQDKNLLGLVRARIPAALNGQVSFRYEKSAAKIAEAINEIAPEHLLLAVKKPRRLLGLIRNAGAIFLGEGTPVALGDYAAGPSHVLPTGGSARFASGLSVKDFLRWSSVIENNSRASRPVFRAAETLARIEGLRYHALSLR